jgi:hypothetical protein
VEALEALDGVAPGAHLAELAHHAALAELCVRYDVGDVIGLAVEDSLAADGARGARQGASAQHATPHPNSAGPAHGFTSPWPETITTVARRAGDMNHPLRAADGNGLPHGRQRKLGHPRRVVSPQWWLGRNGFGPRLSESWAAPGRTRGLHCVRRSR